MRLDTTLGCSIRLRMVKDRRVGKWITVTAGCPVVRVFLHFMSCIRLVMHVQRLHHCWVLPIVLVFPQQGISTVLHPHQRVTHRRVTALESMLHVVPVHRHVPTSVSSYTTTSDRL